MSGKKINIDAGRMKDRNILHDYIRDIFSIEDSFGRNLDAMHDVLSEISEDYELVFSTDDLRSICQDEFAYKAMLVMGKAAEENPHLQIHFSEYETPSI